MLQIEVHRVGGLYLVHKGRQIRLWRLDQKVCVVGHTAEKMKPDFVFLDGLCEPPQEPFVVVIIFEYDAAVNATNRNVVNRPLVLYP